MRIDRRLNLIVPIVDDSDKVIAHVHSTPLSEEAVDQHWMLLGQTFHQIFANGLGRTAGPTMAMRLLKRVAANTEKTEDATALINEIRRLTMVSVPIDGGWQSVPLNVAVDQKFISEEDRAEVENLIVFFISASATLPRKDRKEMLQGVADLYGAQLSPLSSTEWTTSLTTSKLVDNTGEKPPAPAKEDAAPATAIVDGKPASVPL